MMIIKKINKLIPGKDISYVFSGSYFVGIKFKKISPRELVRIVYGQDFMEVKPTEYVHLDFNKHIAYFPWEPTVQQVSLFS